jgi:hypothetical protein
MTGVSAFGDAAWILEVADVPTAHRVAAQLDRALRSGAAPVEVLDVTVGYGSVVVQADPSAATFEFVRLQDWLTELVGGAELAHPAVLADPAVPADPPHPAHPARRPDPTGIGRRNQGRRRGR